MGLFTKKEKKPREIKETDSTFVKLWYNPRTHAMMVLGAYFIFFAVVLIILKSIPEANTKEEKKTGASIKELFNKNPYEITIYDAVIKTGENTYLFNGTDVVDNIISGTLVNKDTKTEIKIENDTCVVYTRDKKNNKVESDEACPSDIKYGYFNKSKIYSLIENLDLKDLEDGNYLIKLNDNTEFKVYSAEVNNKKILSKISITDKPSEYEINYNQVDITSVPTEN